MAAETMQAMPMSPRQSPKEIGTSAVQWACTRRGRMLVLTIVFFTIILGLGGMHNREASHHFSFQRCCKGRNGSVQRISVACGGS
jgi:hypothetical protein